MDLKLAGRTAIITGASGGIGRALTAAFAAEGANLVAHTHRRREELQAWVDEQDWRERALVVQADIRRPEELETAFAAAMERFGSIDICIANAGIRPSADENLRDACEERIRATLEANLTGAVWTARAFLRALRDGSDGASLLFIGSTAASFGERGYADYAAAKSGLVGLVRSLKNEIVALDPRGRVNLLEPGWTTTHVPRPALRDLEQIRRVVRTMPLRRLATADDVARTALWLCSPETGRHLTGQTITVAGGMEGRLLWERAEVDPESIRDEASP
jgi:3-oxoacyl-[acyl-carrier protein] reductase